MNTKVISFVNMKGGVAKTTTTVGVATMLSGKFNKRVLVIDLDPQTNATVMLIGEEAWEQLSLTNRTLYALFHDAVYGEKTFSIEESIQKDVSKINGVPSVDLLPSDLNLMDLDYEIANPEKGVHLKKMTIDILEKAITPVISRYDYVLIDCPPNLGMYTLNGLRISDAYIIPTIPDILSTRGIYSITQRVPRYSEGIECLGIVYTKVRKQSTLHQRIMKTLGSKKKQMSFEEKMRDNSIDAPIFKTVFYESNTVANAAEFYAVSTLKKKWGAHDHYDSLLSFTQEIITKMEK